MKNALFISFDIVREGETEISLSIATILANLKTNKDLAGKITFEHTSINMLPLKDQVTEKDFEGFVRGRSLESYQYILISAYVWNEYFINKFISFLKRNDFKGKIVLGGYQVTYTEKENLSKKYPEVEVFIIGYAEQSLHDLFSDNYENSEHLYLKSKVNFSELKSPYLTDEISVNANVDMLRWETKRGCPYKCSFCAHRDLTGERVHYYLKEKAYAEIDFFNQTNVKRINVLDPIFNMGHEYLDIMKYIVKSESDIQYKLQTRFESIKNEEGGLFLELCESGKFHLEFGLQTFDKSESVNIKRNNNYNIIEYTLKEVLDRKISHEISLIYGLPGQTLGSFKTSVYKLQEMGCNNIKAFPLMLLQGTKLYGEIEKWGMKEEILGEYNIPVVTSSNSFSKNDWIKMNEIADQLSDNCRLT